MINFEGRMSGKGFIERHVRGAEGFLKCQSAWQWRWGRSPQAVLSPLLCLRTPSAKALRDEQGSTVLSTAQDCWGKTAT